MSASSAQTWVAVVGGILTAVVGLLRYFSYRSKRDRMASVGTAFSATVESLRSDDDIERMAAAVLLRRFFERGTEQGGRKRPYKRETVDVIAGILRSLEAGEDDNLFQKVLADGLRYARKLNSADLQRCNLRGAYLGHKPGDNWRLNIANADLYRADCTGASFRKVIAGEAVFYKATLERAVFADADLRRADFREACLADADLRRADFREARLGGAKFDGAKIEGACFADAVDIPQEVRELLNTDSVGNPGAKVRIDGDGS